jgi:hypothetical protein
MKIKMTLLVIITAIITLSFTYVATKDTNSTRSAGTQTSQNDSVNGLVSEEN